MNLGDFIKKAREEKNISIREVSRLSGVSHPYISQIETGKNIKPSYDILNKLVDPLGVSQFDLLVAAGYYTDEELSQRQQHKEFYDSMSPEEAKEYEEDLLKWQIKNWNIKQYQEQIHVRLEDFLNDTRRNFYIDDHKLSNEDIRMLITLYGGKEKDYPSDEQIEEEYEVIKRTKEENKKRIASGEAFFIVNYDDDINTNEDI